MAKAAIIYWSGTGNTEEMAGIIATGMKNKGAEVEVLEVTKADAAALPDYERIAFGCPSMGDEVLEEGDFEPFFTAAETSLGGKKVALFGSYGWGDGQWMRDWVTRTEAAGARLMDDGLIAAGSADAAECTQFGERFAEF